MDVYYQIGNGDFIEFSVRDSDTLIKDIKSATTALSNIICQENIPSDVYGTTKSPLLSNTSYGFSVHYMNTMSFISTQNQDVLARLNSCRNSNIALLSKCDIKLGDKFVILDAPQTTVNYFECTVVDGVVCDKCKQVTLKNKLIEHQASFQCNLEANERQATDLGYEPYYGNGCMDIRAAVDLHSVLVPASYTVYVAPWVKDAITQYHHNEGFAGMSLSEFLNKVAGDKNA
jgi:hypothetical protein